MRAFVTGSTGLLGSNLVYTLLAQGHEVVALARSEQKARKILTDPRIQIVVGDMEDVPAFAPKLAGVDVLFHVAAYFREYYRLGDHDAKLQKINVDGTMQLLELAEKHGVKKTIHVSSSGVLGRGNPADENTPPDDLVSSNLYFYSKLMAEERIAQFVKKHTMPVVMILPTVMIGPRDTAPTAIGNALVQIIERKFPMIPPGGFEFVDARDVAQAMINAVERGRSGERYIVTGGYHSMVDLVSAVTSAARVPMPPIRAPYPLMLTVATFAEFGARLTNSDPLITREAVRTIYAQRKISAAKAIRELGITLRPFEESIRDEVAWFIANGYVKRMPQGYIAPQPV
jgi:dihydroflavonol-4-reductase